MLKITRDRRKLGLDQRLINPMLPDNPQSKINLGVDNILRIWQEGQPEKLTQLLFCDLSTPKGKTAAKQEKAARTPAKKERSSVLEGLKRPLQPRTADRKPKQHEQEVR